MRFILPALIAIALSSCSQPPPPVEKKAALPPEPVGAQKAFFRTYPSARTWAPDVMPLRVESMAIPEVKWGEGKYGAWKITYISPSKQKLKVYTYAVVESPGNAYHDVFSPLEERWSGPSGQTLPFRMEAFKVESDKAWKAAVEKSQAFLAKGGSKPVTFLLEWNKRFSQPSYRIYWGDSIATSEYSVFIDVTSGLFLTKVP